MTTNLRVRNNFRTEIKSNFLQIIGNGEIISWDLHFFKSNFISRNILVLGMVSQFEPNLTRS